LQEKVGSQDGVKMKTVVEEVIAAGQEVVAGKFYLSEVEADS